MIMIRRYFAMANLIRKNTLINKSDLRIVGCESQGFHPSLRVSSEGSTYLFNCGEGLQRYCYSNKLKLVNSSNVFITNLDWHRVAGVWGLALTLQDAGVPELMIHGPEGIENFFESTRSFMSFHSMKIGTQVHTKGHEIFDQGLHIKSIVVNKSGDEVTKRPKVMGRLLAYLCTTPDLPGALNPKKCRDLNVPVGPLLGVLKSGRDVTLPDGSIVRSSDVVSPKQLGDKFLVIECPSEKHINMFTENSELNEIRQSRRNDTEKHVKLVVDFSPDSVTMNPKYQDWINGFADDCKHILMPKGDTNYPNFLSYYRFQYLLRKLDDELFPELYLPKNILKKIEDESKEIQEPGPYEEYGLADPDEAELKTVIVGNICDLDKTVKAEALDKFNLRPGKNMESVEKRLAMDAIYKTATSDQLFDEYLKEYKELQNRSLEPREYEPQVIFLGTGSALPSRLRNTSGILVNFTAPFESSVILDCGEDTYGQILRFYGPEKTEVFLKQLDMVYISHHHADHHLGLITILRNRLKFTDKKIALMLPPGVDRLLNYHNNNFEDLSQTYTIYNTKNFKSSPDAELSNLNRLDILKEELVDHLGGLLRDVTIVGVDHCVNSCAAVFSFNIGRRNMDTFRLAYSGDTRPSEDFVLAGKDCDLLIHEATFDHRGIDDAIEKKHSTSKEAIVVAKKMRAKFTILTHFSQRLPKIPYFTEDFDETIGFAFDNMAVRCPSDFERIPIMKKITSLIFSKSLIEIDQKYVKKQTRQEYVESETAKTR